MLARAKVALQSGNFAKRLVDFVGAKLLYSLPAGMRKTFYAGSEHFCPICETSLRKFLRLHRPYHLWCPVCRSLHRQRIIWLLFAQEGLLDQSYPQRLLHFAPEQCLTERFLRTPNLDYMSTDIADPAAMVQMDITDLQLPDNSFDLILCSHVLEHVPDDHKALSELNRVLKPQGTAILLVPIEGDVTREDLSITDPVKREELYGQFDHVRLYGLDFAQRIQKAGFSTRLLTIDDIATPAEVVYMGLSTLEHIFIAEKLGE